jgi:hypothetical protein
VKSIVCVSTTLLVVFMTERSEVTSRSVSVAASTAAVGFVFMFLLGVYRGLFSGGHATLITFIGVTCFGPRMLESIALMKSVNFVPCATPSSLVPLLFLATVACLAAKLLAHDVVHRALLARI